MNLLQVDESLMQMMEKVRERNPRYKHCTDEYLLKVSVAFFYGLDPKEINKMIDDVALELTRKGILL